MMLGCILVLNSYKLQQAMNQELQTLRNNNEYNSNNVIIKSQKILNSAANFHLKTQQQEKNQQEHKSPQQGRVQFRQTTWRKPRMPYNKFPDAFQMRQKRKSTKKEIIDDLDKIVKYSEYKQVQKYLNPISLEKRAEQKPKVDPDNGNPLATYQKYLKIKNKFSEQLQQRDISLNKYKTLSTKVSGSLVKIQDCITLEVIKRGHNTGTLKKMLHVPSLQLLCVREQPLNTKQSRNSIKEWVNFWQSKLNKESSKHFLKVFGMAFNYPQGAVSILTQYNEEGSLLDLLGQSLTLPQTVIRDVFSQVCDALKEYYEQTQIQFGGLSPSQILISSTGIKLGMGLYYHFANFSSNSIYHLKIPQKASIFQMNITQKNFMKSSIDRPVNSDLQRSLDIFKLGLIMLECSVGGFQNFEQSPIIHETLKWLFSQEGQKAIEKDNVCCLLHSQAYLIEWASRQQRLNKEQLDQSKAIPYFKYLKDRFSGSFVNFLCSCLKLAHDKRASISDLISHIFLNSQSKDCHTVNINLQDLLMITRAQSDPIIQSMKEERLDKFIGHVLQVLSTCNRDDVVTLIKTSKDKILNIGKFIGVNYFRLGDKLLAAITQMAKNMKS